MEGLHLILLIRGPGPPDVSITVSLHTCALALGVRSGEVSIARGYYGILAVVSDYSDMFLIALSLLKTSVISHTSVRSDG